MIQSVSVFVDPFKEEEEKKAEEAAKKKDDEERGMANYGQWFSNPTASAPQAHSSTTPVGKYLPKAAGASAGDKRAIDFGAVKSSQPAKQRRTDKGKAKAFQGW